MHNPNPRFTDEEFEDLLVIKKKTGLNWHDFIIHAAENLNIDIQIDER